METEFNWCVSFLMNCINLFYQGPAQQLSWICNDVKCVQILGKHWMNAWIFVYMALNGWIPVYFEVFWSSFNDNSTGNAVTLQTNSHLFTSLLYSRLPLLSFLHVFANKMMILKVPVVGKNNIYHKNSIVQ